LLLCLASPPTPWLSPLSLPAALPILRLEQCPRLLLQPRDPIRAGEQLRDGVRVLVAQGRERGSDPVDGALDRPVGGRGVEQPFRSEEHTSELQSRFDLVCRLLLVNKK